jgi:hypothetical protein
MKEWGVKQSLSPEKRMKAFSKMNINLKNYVEYEDFR